MIIISGLPHTQDNSGYFEIFENLRMTLYNSEYFNLVFSEYFFLIKISGHIILRVLKISGQFF